MTDRITQVWCPIYDKKISVDLCRDHQMVGDNEFIPRIMEDELVPGWRKKCENCPNAGRFSMEPPEMDHE
ncbi:MAG: hypothetical protein VB070_14370 [Clostridiaceae bacterium]|nr:hypothetical protein [Clostridiaceae bacterium]